MHEGHRDRVRKRFREEGLDHFSDVQALELLLFYVIPRGDTNPIAHELLSHFGSISQVLEAGVEDLCKVPGVGEKTALFLTMIPQMGRFYLVDRSRNATVLPTLENCAAYLMPRFFGRKLETVFLLCLDAKCKVLCCREIGEGSVNAASISVRKVVEAALSANATSVVLAHNHPSGVALPSADDVQTTRRIAAALSAVEINLIDHIVVAEGDFISMAQSGYRFDEYQLT